MKTVLVTGANGYIGRHVTCALKELGASVIALDRSSCDNSCADEEIIADIFAPDFDLHQYTDILPDACLHLAWRNGFSHNDTSHIEDLPLHFAFLSKLAASGVAQIAVMGTMHEVGYWEGAIDANTPCNPQSLYAISKNALRESLEVEFSGKAVLFQWLRGFYIYGDDANSQSIFGKLLRAVADGKKTFPFTSGKNLYDFLSVDELSEMIGMVVMQDKFSGIIHCCSGEPISLSEMIEGFIEKNGLDIALDYGAFPDRPYDSPGIWGNANVIRQIMGK